MSSRQYIIVTDRMTLSDQKEYKLKALAAGLARTFQQSIGNGLDVPSRVPKSPTPDECLAYIKAGSWPPSIDQRDFQCALDAGAAVDHWRTAPLVAVGTPYSIFQAIAVPAVGLRANAVVVWYGVTLETVPTDVSRIIFRRTNAAGSVIAEFDLEELAVQQTLDCFFSEPVIWDKEMPYSITVLAKIATGAFSRVKPKNFLFEPAGTLHV